MLVLRHLLWVILVLPGRKSFKSKATEEIYSKKPVAMSIGTLLRQASSRVRVTSIYVRTNYMTLSEKLSLRKEASRLAPVA